MVVVHCISNLSSFPRDASLPEDGSPGFSFGCR